MDNLPAIVEPSPLILIQQALEAKIPASELKGFFDLQVRHEQRRAEEAYAEAITAFQGECPYIKKNAVNSHSGKAYPDYEGIMRIITPLLRKYRIVVTFDTSEFESKMLTTCRIRVGIVEKVTTISLPVESASKMMNSSQAGGAAMTYGRRYALTAALNLVFTDEDTDGLPPAPTAISKADEDILANLMTKAGYATQAATDRFLDYASKVQNGPQGPMLDNLADINTATLPTLVAFLEKKIAERAAKESK